jgi:hypothetical protein
MRLGLIVGLGITAVAALAAADPPRIAMMGHPHHAADLSRIDANGDGWLTRAEASAAAERIFGDLDTNDDGKLDAQDRGRGQARVFERRIVRSHGKSAEDVVIMHRAECPHGADAPEGARAKAGARVAHHPPMAMMMMHSSEEADRNGDGSLSADEFRAQHLRFFDAGDGNGDGRIRFHLPDLPGPPEPPAPPESAAPPHPPAPPQAPRN